ncbi:4-alpha-glucanotransferase [soil metagenome]
MTAVRGMLELARLYGVETSYEGMGGEVRKADPHALALTLHALGAPLTDERDVRGALRARRRELDACGIQPVHVAWNGVTPAVRLRLPHVERERTSVQLRLETGEIISDEYDAEPTTCRASGGWTATHTVRVQPRLPIGYHDLVIETRSATLESRIIAAPRHAFATGRDREWGVFAPLYSLCSASSYAIGDYADLRSFAEWVGSLGGGFVSTLPLLSTLLDAPFDPSPYSPASRLFWNELFVHLQAVPGWAPGHADIEGAAAACRSADHVDYQRAAALKRRELQRAMGASADNSAVQDELRHFVASHPRVEDYARFRAVCDRRREGWQTWPDRMRNGMIRDGDYAPEDLNYHLFAQWQADSQLAAVAGAREAGAAALYLDMPLGVNPAGYDAWRFRDLFAEGVSAGAPPDPLFTGGQDWGFRPLNPRTLRATGYQYLIDTFRHHLRHASMLRMDHVMSLYRLFWVPHGLGARDGVYVRYADDELFAVLLLESVRHRAVVVGEDLGTVPPAVRRAMDRHGVYRMHVVQFEASPDHDPPTAAPPENVIASLNTHDMPTFAGFWRGSEIDDQLDLQLIDEDGHSEAMLRRARLRLMLSRSVGGGGEIDAALARQRLLEHLAASDARYVLVNLEDLWMEERPQNVPGTNSERPNWKRRARRSLDDFVKDAAIRRMLKSIDERRTAPITALSHD